VILAGATVLLAGCGFKPMYANNALAPTLARVEVIAPDGRAGALIREHLDDALGRNGGGAPAYRMTLSIGETRYPRGVRIDNTATRYEYVLTANYVLRALSTGTDVKTGRAQVILTYDSADQPYASIMGQQDAQDRATEEAARRIQLELASWFAQGQPPPPTPTPQGS
jgi:LPS-assembly lipoprotein